MASKNFYYQLILRVVLLVVFAMLMSYNVIKEQYGYALVAIGLLIYQSYLLVRFFNKNNRKMAYFFEALKNEDYSTFFPEDTKSPSLNELNVGLNKMNNLIRNNQMGFKRQENYYQEILNQASIGIMTINGEGHILFSNPTSKEIFNKSTLSHVRQLESIDINLYHILSELKPFDRKLFNFYNERDNIQLAIKSSLITQGEEELMLVVIQDIRTELEEKETDSWMKLIRVMTHEIMNSITPITSISESILGYYKQEKEGEGEVISQEQIDNTAKGLEVINRQSKDLMTFVQSYRSFMQVPEPNKKIVLVKDLFEKVEILINELTISENVSVNISDPENLELFIDEQQMTQLLVNLSKNAMQSMEKTKDAILDLIAGTDDASNKYIQVRDNGPGITPEIMSQIFIPFFTTKESGSGIGLSLSKHVMQRHGGRLKVQSEVGVETSFVLEF